jgi:hypothetical protein
MQDEQPEREEHGYPGRPGDVVPIYNQTLAMVIEAGREIRQLHPRNPVEMTCLNSPYGQISTVTYKLPDNKGGVHFRIGGRQVNPTLQVRVWPTTLFQEKVLPGELLFRGLMRETGFLDPPVDIIRFQEMTLAMHMGRDNVCTIHFYLVGDDNMYAGVRLVLNKIAFAD